MQYFNWNSAQASPWQGQRNLSRILRAQGTVNWHLLSENNWRKVLLNTRPTTSRVLIKFNPPNGAKANNSITEANYHFRRKGSIQGVSAPGETDFSAKMRRNRRLVITVVL